MQTRNNKIGIGLITCDRLDFYIKSFFSIKKTIGTGENYEFIVINDGKDEVTTKPSNYFKTKGREGVAKAKNHALRFLIEKKCEHIFLLEDDVEVIDADVFNFYINASKKTGLKHFNYALHGNNNLNHLNQPNILKTINYPNTDVSIDLYPNVLGAFSYYHIDVLKDVGLMDENFYNAMEHVDHTYQIIKKGYNPPFRYFVDVNGSSRYLKDIVPDHNQSKIRSQSDFQQVFKNGVDTFIEKNKFSVIHAYGPAEKVATQDEAIKSLREIWKKYYQE